MKPYKKFFKTKESKIQTKDNDTLLAIVMHNHTGTISGPLLERFFFYEAVINVEPEKKEIKNITLSVFKKYKGEQINVIIPYIEMALSKHKIKFDYLRAELDVYTSSGRYEPNDDTLHIILSDKTLKKNPTENDYKEFVNDFSLMVGHELIHRFEAIKMNNIELANRLLKVSILKQKLYYGSKYEIMAYAWQIVNTFRLFGKIDSDIKIMLRSNSDVKFKYGDLMLKKYHDIFTIQDAELKLLYKYMYLYLK